ncbi:hypothetical protein HHK36_027165 [Tetracentron sinense]|uniref:Hyaluronan/mRNA-binding protein domain-containing protein n=1 Tax=Tetracentron sinense TaxID=13715 RepID=A0A834YKQ7_TETSI|nr:hypothetical protein HHK36_027165 [Tetracentron sinense]
MKLRDVPETREIPRDVDLEEGKPKQLVSQDIADKKVPEDEENEMTLDEYEKLCFEKRKALEALKNEERKVTPDKDFELMKLVEKKKEENLFIKLKSEKDKLKNKDSLEKEEKVRKSVTIKEFLKPAEGENYIWPTARGRGGRGRGRVERGGHREGFLGLPGIKAAPAPCIEDPDQFPLLGEL